MAKLWGITPQEKSFSFKKNDEFKEAGLLKLNCDKALFLLDWTPSIDFNELVVLTTEWYKAYYNKNKNLLELTYSQLERYFDIAKGKKQNWLD